MDKAELLIVAMAQKCRGLIKECKTPDTDLPKALQPKHLLWLCNKIDEDAEDRPATQLHRWIGFIQGAMMAHRMLDHDGAKAMFDQAKKAHGTSSDDLLDHLDPTSSFKVDIGGQG